MKFAKLVAFHGCIAIIGAIGLTLGMYLQFIQPFNVNETFGLVAYIIGDSTILLSFTVFVLVTFTIEKE